MIYSLTVYIFLIGGIPYKGNIFLCEQKLEKAHSKQIHDTSICLSLDKTAIILHKNQGILSIVKIYASRAGKACKGCNWISQGKSSWVPTIIHVYGTNKNIITYMIPSFRASGLRV